MNWKNTDPRAELNPGNRLIICRKIYKGGITLFQTQMGLICRQPDKSIVVHNNMGSVVKKRWPTDWFWVKAPIHFHEN